MKNFFSLVGGALLLHWICLAAASEGGFLLPFWQLTGFSLVHYATCFFFFAPLVKSPAVRAAGTIFGISLHAFFAFLVLVVADGAHMIPRIFPQQKDPIIAYMTNLTMYFILGFGSTLVLGVLSILFRRRLTSVGLRRAS